MLGIMREGQRAADREDAARRRAWRKSIVDKYGVSVEFKGLSHDEFCRAVIEALPLAAIRNNDHLQVIADLEHLIEPRGKPTWRCQIFGCNARGRCTLHPYCTDCQGRCKLCGIAVVPRAVPHDRGAP
jgi:hypothetical protein